MPYSAYLRRAQARYTRTQRLYEEAAVQLKRVENGAFSTGYLDEISTEWKRLHLDALLMELADAEGDLVEAFRRAVTADPTASGETKHNVRVLFSSRQPDATAQLVEMALNWRTEQPASQAAQKQTGSTASSSAVPHQASADRFSAPGCYADSM